MAGKKIEVLLVEDDPGDVDLMTEALRGRRRFVVNLHVVRDGAQALQYLHKEGSYADAPRPDLILLDLNLPKKNGREVLLDIKGDKALKCIPVVVLTTSDSEEDIVQAYQGGANCYITKPVELSRFIRLLRSLEDFWFSLVKLPPRNGT